MRLPAVVVKFDAVVAEAVSTISGAALVSGNVASRNARAIVVVNAMCCWLLGFVNGMELGCCRHGIAPLCWERWPHKL